jgi:hypothetical protein
VHSPRIHIEALTNEYLREIQVGSHTFLMRRLVFGLLLYFVIFLIKRLLNNKTMANAKLIKQKTKQITILSYFFARLDSILFRLGLFLSDAAAE